MHCHHVSSSIRQLQGQGQWYPCVAYFRNGTRELQVRTYDRIPPKNHTVRSPARESGVSRRMHLCRPRNLGGIQTYGWEVSSVHTSSISPYRNTPPRMLGKHRKQLAYGHGPYKTKSCDTDGRHPPYNKGRTGEGLGFRDTPEATVRTYSDNVHTRSYIGLGTWSTDEEEMVSSPPESGTHGGH